MSQGRSILVADETEEMGDIWADFMDAVTSMCPRIYGKHGTMNRAEEALEAVNEPEGKESLQDRAEAKCHAA
jgi:predicted site-specific integrase-resolvase